VFLAYRSGLRVGVKRCHCKFVVVTQDPAARPALFITIHKLIDEEEDVNSGEDGVMRALYEAPRVAHVP
jgi:hypothetical protein